jgi:SAM-dependent methyltransferase
MSGNGGGHDKSGKADFDGVYDLDDPRGYFETLGSLGYQVPQHGQRLFSALIEALREGGRDGAGSSWTSVVDVCCSYGVTAALLKYQITLDDLYARYLSEELADLSSEELAEADSAFYVRQRRREMPLKVIGLDVAEKAVAYGRRANLLDAGFAENLEEGEPTEELRRAVAGVNLLAMTGCVGYISGRTLKRLLDCAVEGPEGRVPRVAALALRWVSYKEISETLSEYGLVTEKLEGHTFPQRRFVDDEEREYVLEELAKAGVDPTGKEDTGWYHTDFYLSRPAEETETPLETLLAPAL